MKKLFLKSAQYPQETPVLGSPFKNVAGLKACNIVEKRPQSRYFPVSIAKFLILFSEIVCKERPKGSRSRLHEGVRLQDLIHRSSFLFLS